MVNSLYKKPFFTSAPSAEAYLGDLKADGTVPLTADWNVGAFDLTCVDMNATNFKLSGVGTLTSALGNVSLTTSLTAASGNEVGFLLSPTINKAAGNYTAFKVNATEIGAPGTADLLMDLQVGTTSQFKVDNAGAVTAAGTYRTSGDGYANSSGVSYWGFEGVAPKAVASAGYISFQIDADLAAGGVFLFKQSSTKEMTDTDGSQAFFDMVANVNQSGTAGYQGIKLNVTETALGSGATGANRLATLQVGSTERVGFDNKGFEIRTFTKVLTDGSATDVFSINVPAGSTAGGVITYTIDVTDDDTSDDQIEVGTVQFCGLQDEANWHTNISEVSTQALESGTLATTWAIDTATANTMKITCNANSDLTTPVVTLRYTVTFNNAYTVTTY